MTVVKGIASILTKPLVIAMCVAVIAAAFRAFGRRRSAAGNALAAAMIIYLSALSPSADLLLGPLERRYPPLAVDADLNGIAFIVVLGSGYHPEPNIPITAAIDAEGLARIVEGVRLAHRYNIPLLASGGGPAGKPAPALGYARLARDLGVEESSLIVSTDGRDTHAEVLAIVRQIGTRPFIVVTSASHMPRAMALFRREGANPLAAPTAQHVCRVDCRGPGVWLPSTIGLQKTELALHEYLGLLALRLGLD
jgi:uncharacterized SAM-binding protein YcdF (DUF218 family)